MRIFRLHDLRIPSCRILYITRVPMRVYSRVIDDRRRRASRADLRSQKEKGKKKHSLSLVRARHGIFRSLCSPTEWILELISWETWRLFHLESRQCGTHMGGGTNDLRVSRRFTRVTRGANPSKGSQDEGRVVSLSSGRGSRERYYEYKRTQTSVRQTRDAYVREKGRENKNKNEKEKEKERKISRIYWLMPGIT